MTDRELRFTGKKKLIAMIRVHEEQKEALLEQTKKLTEERQSLCLSVARERNEKEALAGALELEQKKTEELSCQIEELRAKLESQLRANLEEKDNLLHMAKQLERALDLAEEAEERFEEENEKLHDRAVQMTEAGTIAEALMIGNGTLESIQETADEYLSVIEDMNRNKDIMLRKREMESRRRADKMLEDARRDSMKIRSEAEEYRREIYRRVEQLEDESSMSGALLKALNIRVSDLASDKYKTNLG